MIPHEVALSVLRIRMQSLRDGRETALKPPPSLELVADYDREIALLQYSIDVLEFEQNTVREQQAQRTAIEADVVDEPEASDYPSNWEVSDVRQEDGIPASEKFSNRRSFPGMNGIPGSVIRSEEREP